MSENASQVLGQWQIGRKLIFENHIIAEIIAKNDNQVKIRDIHGKGWVIHQADISDLTLQSFLENLAKSIARSRPKVNPEGCAREVLTKLTLGDELRDQNGRVGTLVGIHPHADIGLSLTFKNLHGNLQTVYPDLLPNDLSFNEYLHWFQKRIQDPIESSTEPLLFRYFKEEFVLKMLAQMAYDHERWGDSWLMQPIEGHEQQIHERFNEYFAMFYQHGKKIPWLKIAGYAIIAQAREDHPEWLL